MYILLYNQSCFNIKIKWLPLTPLKSLSNIYIEARHPVFTLWLYLPGMLPLPAGVCITQFESCIIPRMWIWIRDLKRSVGWGSGNINISTNVKHTWQGKTGSKLQTQGYRDAEREAQRKEWILSGHLGHRREWDWSWKLWNCLLYDIAWLHGFWQSTA